MPIPNRDDRTYHPVGLSVEEFRELATSGEVVTLHSGGNVGYDIAVNLNEADLIEGRE